MPGDREISGAAITSGLGLSGDPEPWRAEVLRGMLTVAAIVAPLLDAVAVLARASGLSGVDIAVLLSTAVIFPVLRLTPGTSVAPRAALVIAIVFLVSVYLTARDGFAAGLSVSLTTACVLGVIYLGRVFASALVALSAIAVVTVGILVTRGRVVLVSSQVDPFQLRNWVRMAGSTSLLAALLVLVIDFVIRQVEASARGAAEALARVRLAYAGLGHLRGRLEAAKEEERRFIAHELHDELGQTLTALKLRLQLALRQPDAAPAPEARDSMEEAIRLIDRLIARVRRISGELRPPLLDDIGLVPALRAYLESQTALSGVAIHFEGQEPAAGMVLPPDLEIACFRVVQEAITNALHHAAARQVHVRLVRSASRILLSIRDDGRGFDPALLDGGSGASHLGVIGMRERVRDRAGIFTLSSRPGAGTTVEIDVPIDRAQGAREEARPAVPSGSATAPKAFEPWLEDVQHGMLTVAAVVVPALCALALFVGLPRRDPPDIVVLTATGLLLPLLRLARPLPLSARAAAALAILFSAGVYVLAKAGFATGVSVLLVATCAITAICFGRKFGFALIGLSALAHTLVGVLVTRGTLHLNPAEVDPLQLRNWFRMAATISLVASLLNLVIDFVIRQVETNARATTRAVHALRHAYEQLGQLHERLEAAKEQERRFIAHELHDELGQTLTAIKLRIQLGAGYPGSVIATLRTPSGAGLDPIVLIDQLITRVRKISVDLRPPLLDEIGLVPTLRSYLESQATVSGVAIAFEAEEPEGAERLQPDLEIGCFRVVQESITNALRHASPGAVEVRIVRDATRVSLSIRDDGKGFDPTSTLEVAAADGHLGVIGIQERVRTGGGTFRLSSRPGMGTTVEIELPVGPGRRSPAS